MDFSSNQHATVHTTATTLKSNSAYATPHSCPQVSTAECLEQLSLRMSELINDRLYDDPMIRQYHSADLYASQDDAPATTSLEQYLAHFRHNVSVNPGFSFKTLSTCSSVRESGRAAVVWMTVLVGGMARKWCSNLCREIVVMCEWKRLREGWKCVRLAVLPGSTFQ